MSENNDKSLESFIDEVCDDSHLRIEDDLGDGYVRLRSSEAEKRQAAQDIRSVEDAIIEMLRNARDAHAKNIFLSLARCENTRKVVMIDDGCGIPDHLTNMVFEPRVTSKLDTFHEDRWGVHGRGMALFSIRENANDAHVICSAPSCGTSIYAEFNNEKLKEKKDQSTFPQFITSADGRTIIRGPHNILRICVEFSIECNNSVNVFVGRPAEIVSTLYEYGCSVTSKQNRLFVTDYSSLPLIKRLCYARTPEELSSISNNLGLDISNRGARRVLDGEISSVLPLKEIIENHVNNSKINDKKEHAQASIQNAENAKPKDSKKIKTPNANTFHNAFNPHFSRDDIQKMKTATKAAYIDIADGYYLDSNVDIDIKVVNGYLRINIPILDKNM